MPGKTHRLVGAGGSAFTQPSNDGITTASATGLAIGVITVQGGSAEANSDPTVTLNVGGTSGNTTSLRANTIKINTKSVVQTKTSSATDGGGLIGVGDSHADGASKTTNKITIGTDAQLTALFNVEVKSRSELYTSGSTDPNIVGFIGVALAVYDAEHRLDDGDARQRRHRRRRYGDDQRDDLRGRSRIRPRRGCRLRSGLRRTGAPLRRPGWARRP